MPKAYWIVHIDVSNPERYKNYGALARPALARYGGRFIVRGGAAELKEGHVRPRHVVVEFASMRDALDCYDSPEYQAAKAIRLGAADFDLTIVEGYEA